MRRILCVLLTLTALGVQSVEAQSKDSTITGIYTDFKNYWTTSVTSNSSIYPDTSHNLLAFTFRGKTYSTGVNDAVLTSKLGSSNYTPQVFRSLPISNIAGKTIGSDNTLAFALKDDGDSTQAAYQSPYPVINIDDVLTDGKNGLDLGTGVTNLPQGAHISFPVEKLASKSATDVSPDFVFTQIAQPTTNVPDTIYFVDANNNVVGNKKLVYWNAVSKLGTYKLDLYSLTPNMDCNTSIMNSLFEQNGTRDIRMVGFLITEFGITSTTLAGQVKGLQINPGGSSDQAFIAYNTNTIVFDVPAILNQPTTQVVCSTTGTSATFSVNAYSTTAMTYQWKKNGANISGATSSSYTATNLKLSDTANAYSVTIKNSVGGIKSDNAYIKFVITSQPSPASLYLPTGSSASFTVGTSSIATNIQWQQSGRNIVKATSPTYTDPSLALSDAGNYTALVTYPGGACTSSAVSLTVENLPTITTQPVSQSFCTSATTTATFTVANAPSTSTLSYQWYKNGAAISGATASTLSLTNLTLADTANTYYVILKNGVGSTKSNTASINYIIITQPAPVSQSLIVGSSLNYTVQGSDLVTAYQWQLSGKKITKATLPSYTSSSVALSDAGDYSAILTYPGGTCTTSIATLTVDNVPVITSQPLPQSFCTSATTTATFSVSNSASVSAVSYQWYKNGAAITGATASTLSLSGLTLADTANTYYVTVKNAVGITQSNPVAVNYIIVAQPSPSSRNLATGSSATFTLKGSDITTAYQWQRNGANIPGATAAIYTDASVALNEAGTYTAILTYPGGSCTTSAATLTVENLPSITKQPVSVVACTASATTASFTVTNAASTSALSYQWYKNDQAITGATAATLSLSGLTLADSANNYYVILKNSVGIVQSNTVSIDYIIYSQPASLSLYPNAAARFTVGASNIKTYQWQKNGANIGGPSATLASYTDASVSASDSGSYQAIVTYNATTSYPGGTCTSNPATLTVLGLPSILVQPLSQTICNSTTTSASFSVVATSTVLPGSLSNIALSYQWYKKGQAIAGATAASYTATGLTLADTANAFTVIVTNQYGSLTSSPAYVNYVILTQPSSLYLATGNAASFSLKTSGASSVIWMKNGVNISGATALSYALPIVNYADSGSYAALVTYNGGVCTSNAAVLKTAIVLYSTTGGNLNDPKQWGVNVDGSGSTPLNFLRDEHTFVVSNRAKGIATIGGDLSIAGTFDVAATNVTLADNSTLTAGRIIRSLKGGMLGASEKDSIIIKGIPSTPGLDSSDLYFDPANNTAQRLVISGSNVALHTALNITNNNGNKAGSNGVVQITGGTLYTNDSLTLKSNILGTGSIASSTGTIVGKVTIEKYINNKRSWRLMGAPVAATGAPTIHDAYQEGAVSSTDNPHPGYGTHITYGALSDGYDQNPQKSFSMKVLSNGSWVGVPPTNKTKVTDYSAYMFFIRGNRSYPITSTSTTTPATTTVLRVTGYLNQGTLPVKTVAPTGTTLVVNPYACPISFTKLVSASSNLKARLRMWDPNLAGTKGVGGWVTIDGTSGTYRATPPSTLLTLVQAGQGFYVESADGKTSGSLAMNENVKDLSTITTSNDRMEDDMAADTSLEVDLKIMNADSSFSVADGVLYHFNAADNDSIDGDDAGKIPNFNENLSINEEGTPLTIDARTMPGSGDSMKLNLSGFTATSYQLQVVPSSLPSNRIFSLYDKYLNTLTPISNGDTTLVTFSVSSAAADSKAINRFSIVVSGTKFLLPVTFTKVRAYKENKAVVVAWSVENESGVASYEVERSASGTTFSKMGSVTATGASAYSLSDAAPLSGMNYYRVKSIDRSGATHYTSIVSVNVTAAAASSSDAAVVSVYPNPVTGNFFNLTLTNMEAGTYTLSVTSSKGADVLSKEITHAGGTASQKVMMSRPLPAGSYFLTLTSANGTKSITKILAL